jgi:hypothetical protein
MQCVSNAKSLQLHFIDDGSDFYRYTARRWLFNEYQQLQTRYVRFRISSLAAIAARCVGHEPAASSELRNCQKEILMSAFSLPWLIDLKLSRGSLIQTLDSEVAKMDFVCACRNTPFLFVMLSYTNCSQVRYKLEAPVPKVLAWSSCRSENPAGAEYIVMEKAPGSSLAQLWPHLSNEQKNDYH